jgi:alpha-2-macroglobulin
VSGTCELPRAADQNVIPRELGGLVGRCYGRTVWIDATETRSIFRGSDVPRELVLPGPTESSRGGAIDLALGQPGLYVAEVAGLLPGIPALEAQKVRYMSTLAMVTNMAVHVMWWSEGALVWVNRLSDGKPVQGADVTITDYCKGAKLWEGRTGQQGIAMSQYVFGPRPQQSACEWGGRPFLVSARADRGQPRIGVPDADGSAGGTARGAG